MADTQTLAPARDLAASNKTHFPNESKEYRAARNALLAGEIELRRHLERVAEQRRAMPPGGKIPQDFEFASDSGPVRLSNLFRDKNTLMIYSMMFGPQRKGPCPSCTSCLASWNGTAINLRERVAIAVTARSPIERLRNTRGSVASRTSRFSPTPPGTTPAPMSTPKTQTSPASPSLPGKTEPSATSTQAR